MARAWRNWIWVQWLIGWVPVVALFAGLMMIPNAKLLLQGDQVAKFAVLMTMGMLAACSVVMVLAFRGGLSRHWPGARAWMRRLPNRAIDQPALFIGGSRDLVLKMIPGSDPIALMKPHLPNLQGAHILEGCGHWTQQERPDEVNALLIPWLKGL